jgi:hypothetical protein
LDDVHSFLLLVQKHKKQWGTIRDELCNHQHRRTQETPETLNKKFQNLAGKSSKFLSSYVPASIKMCESLRSRQAREDVVQLLMLNAAKAMHSMQQAFMEHIGVDTSRCFPFPEFPDFDALTSPPGEELFNDESDEAADVISSNDAAEDYGEDAEEDEAHSDLDLESPPSDD